MTVEQPIWARSLVRVLTLAMMVISAPQLALGADEDDAEVVEEIVVTGSRIKRSDFTSPSPITVISGESILDSGTGDLGEALRRSVVAGSGGFSQQNVLSGGGATSIDLRDLGPDRVLVLINGKRVARFADSLANEAADLTFLPNAMVDRVEILRDGASAAYGSDAITGVVNVILKERFEGVQANVLAGQPSDDGGEFNSLALTMGATSDRGSVILGAEYRYRNNVPHRERDWAFPAISFIGGSVFGNGSSRNPGGIFFDDNGTTYCTVPRALGGDERTVQSTGCGYQVSADPSDRGRLINYDYALEQDIVNAFDIYSTAGYANYSITDNTEAFLEVQYSKRLSESRLDGNPLFGGTPGVPDGWVVPDSNPNLLPGMLGGTFGIRPSSTIGIRDTEIESNTIRMVGGLRGEIINEDSFLNNWSWELSYLYTRVNADQTTNAIYNLNRANIISDPARCAADSVCSQVVNASGALDVLRPANWTAEEINYLKQISTSISKFQTTGFFALATGPIFEMPAGEVNLAIGAETRTDEGFAKPDSVTLAGESVANQTFISEGSFSVDELFAEIELPLLRDTSFAEFLTLNLQARYADYSNFGNETVTRVGIDWQILEDVRLRANLSTAYRAPTVTDLFGGGTVAFDRYADPCADPTLRASDTTVDGNCLLDGIAPGFVQPATQFPVLRGSNPDLDPEEADTSSIGVVYTPRFIEGLSITLDYWDIEVENLISNVSSASIINACYTGPAGLAAPECDEFSRDSLGQPAGLVNRLANLDKVSTDGYDLRVVYETELFNETFWVFDLNGTYVKENTFAPGTGNYTVDIASGFPRIQATFRTDVQWNEWEFSWFMNYTHSMNDVDFDGNNIFGYDEVNSHLEHDIRVGYNWDQYRVVFGVNDLFDNDPPFAFDGSTNTAPFIYDAIGRFMFLRVSADL